MTKIQNSEFRLQNHIREKVTLKVSNIGTFEFRYCFGQFYKIRRASDLEFFGQAQAQKTKDKLALACPG
jgi:hypothetical protein